jgi:hypothetical protein
MISPGITVWDNTLHNVSSSLSGLLYVVTIKDTEASAVPDGICLFLNPIHSFLSMGYSSLTVLYNGAQNYMKIPDVQASAKGKSFTEKV